ncbi:MAG: Gfo/Idh/MocA family oxidoreductase, partial [Planctomycetes bacterium]|nr:Gfo/Idh/MocA family oxidoreductase [Planctomycetota bacterium]
MTEATRAASRREFLGAVALGAPYFLTSTALGAEGRAPASDRITMGSVGLGGRGSGNTRGFLNFGQIQMLAVCDVVLAKREAAKRSVDQKYGNTDCLAINDFREITSRPNIDTVVIGTPDHWHAIIACEAMKAGKDVFCEKPETLTIREGRIMVETARRYGRVFSGGSQRVLGDYGALARYIRSGAIGKVKEAFVSVGGPSRECDLPPEPVPPGLDWDLWLGPAPWAPFNKGRLGFRAWKDYSGGGMTDWGAHKFGAVVFAMDLQETGPVEILPPD